MAFESGEFWQDQGSPASNRHAVTESIDNAGMKKARRAMSAGL